MIPPLSILVEPTFRFVRLPDLFAKKSSESRRNFSLLTRPLLDTAGV